MVDAVMSSASSWRKKEWGEVVIGWSLAETKKTRAEEACAMETASWERQEEGAGGGGSLLVTEEEGWQRKMQSDSGKDGENG